MSGERVANEGLGKIGERLVTRPGREALKGIGQHRTLPEKIEWSVAGADGAMRAIIQSGVRRGCHGGCSSSATSGMPAIEQPPSIWQSAERFDKQRAEAEQSGYSERVPCTLQVGPPERHCSGSPPGVICYIKNKVLSLYNAPNVLFHPIQCGNSAAAPPLPEGAPDGLFGAAAVAAAATLRGAAGAQPASPAIAPPAASPR